MKSYTITVNGNVYDVTVEENGSVSAPAAAPRRAAAPAAPAAAPKAAAPAGGAGSVKIEAGAAGKVLSFLERRSQCQRRGFSGGTRSNRKIFATSGQEPDFPVPV